MLGTPRSDWPIARPETALFDRPAVDAGRRLLVGLAAASALSACGSLPGVGPGGLAGDDGEPGLEPIAGGPAGLVSDEQAREVAFLALSLVDTPYRYGGNTPAGGFDCSGLIVYAFREAVGHGLPRTVSQIARAGRPIQYQVVRTGDIVLFDTAGRFTHAGIYVGSGRFVHAPSTGGLVRLDGVRARYWRPRFSGVRRV